MYDRAGFGERQTEPRAEGHGRLTGAPAFSYSLRVKFLFGSLVSTLLVSAAACVGDDPTIDGTTPTGTDSGVADVTGTDSPAGNLDAGDSASDDLDAGDSATDAAAPRARWGLSYPIETLNLPYRSTAP